MNTSFDVIVVGLGAAGSAAAYHIARRGLRVLGLDRFNPPHTLGSSHGGSRIIRKAYYEGAAYVAMIERSYTLWRALEDASGTSLLRITGGLMIGAEDSTLIQGAHASATEHGIEHELLSREDVKRRFSMFQLPETHIALWEPGAGILHPERCIQAHLDGARQHGAALHANEHVTGWWVEGDGVRVETNTGTYRAGILALCAGSWINELLSGLDLPLRVERQVNGWFRPRANPDQLTPEHCPVYMWEFEPGRLLYGFPDLGEGVKAGIHHGGQEATYPGELDREVQQEDGLALRRVIGALLPDAAGPYLHASTCLYTNTPDKHFLIDCHPEHPHVLIASACSGHGFKMSSAIGEAIADLCTGEPPRFDLTPFRLRPGIS